MANNLTLTSRVLIISIAISSAAVTMTIFSYWSIAIAVLLIIITAILYFWSRHQQRRVFDFLILFTGFHGIGILILAFALLQKQLTFTEHRAMVNFIDVAVVVAGLLFAWSSYSFHNRNLEPVRKGKIMPRKNPNYKND